MPYIRTLTILEALRTSLLGLAHPDPAKAAAGDKLFEKVIFHENKKLREALQDLIVTQQRVCVIVPGGDDFENTRSGHTVRSVRGLRFDLLIADRAWTKGGHEAVFGGAANLGVLAMKDAVIEHLVENCQLGLPYVVLMPEEGQQITLADEQVKDSPGRECFVLNYSTPAGEETINPPQRRI